MNDQKTILVALDFSECSKEAFHKACDMFHDRIERIIALHVIDSEFVQRCVTHRLGEEQKIKKELFIEAKRKLRKFLDRENLNGVETEAVVSEGIPYLEISKKARALNVDLVIIGSCGRAAKTEEIFFGTTAEKVLRFITYPVLCIPPNTEFK